MINDRINAVTVVTMVGTGVKKCGSDAEGSDSADINSFNLAHENCMESEML